MRNPDTGEDGRSRSPLKDEEDLATSTGGASGQPPLHERAEGLSLGQCDAFFSHSWRDDGASKYTQLCEWAQPFLAESHTPSIWLDKACIDQNDIDGSLAGLPIFLSGCQTLLILAGETYASRLWCVMELFVLSACGASWALRLREHANGSLRI